MEVSLKIDGELLREISYMALDQNISKEQAVINALTGYANLRRMSKPYGSCVALVGADHTNRIKLL